MDNGKLTALSLLDLSAAFGHDILLYTGILFFLAKPFCGLVPTCQTDSKELTYLVYARAPNIFYLESIQLT